MRVEDIVPAMPPLLGRTLGDANAALSRSCTRSTSRGSRKSLPAGESHNWGPAEPWSWSPRSRSGSPWNSRASGIDHAPRGRASVGIGLNRRCARLLEAMTLAGSR